VKQIDYSTTRGQKEVYCLIINNENPRFPRTQAEVCALLDIAKTTCSDRVKRLVDFGFIVPIERTEQGTRYRKGPLYKVIEAQITAESLGSGPWYDTYGHAIRPPVTSEPYKPLYRMHLNGGWVKFSVATEGRLDYILTDQDSVKIKLFGEADPYHTPGSLNWYGKFKFNDTVLGIRYQRTKKKNKFFYIQPGSLIVDSTEVTPDEDVIGPFSSQCRPFLQYLEKYAEWIFKRTSDNDFLIEASVRGGHIGTKEYGLDDYLTGIIKERAGDIGIPGVTNFWTDKSSSAMGSEGEAEFNKASYAHALEQLPITQAKVERSDTEFRILREESRIMEVQIEESYNKVLKHLKRQQEEIEFLVGLENQRGES